MPSYNVEITHYKDGSKKIKQFMIPVKTGFSKESKAKEKKALNMDSNYLLTEFNKRPIRSIRRTKMKLHDYGRNNIFQWFATITFKTQDEFDIMTRQMTKFLKNLKKVIPSAYWLGCPEYKNSNGEEFYHFHIMFGGDIDDYMEFKNAVNPHNGRLIKDKFHQQVFNSKKLESCGFGFNTFSPILNSTACVLYMLKYISKNQVEHLKGKRRYWASRNLDKPIIQKLMINDTSSIESLYHDQLVKDTEFIKIYERKQ